jgi:RNA polymerase sigma-70 factor (ECF subfamily)
VSQFPETVWPLIDLAVSEGKTGSREHMGKLLENYWQPMYAHVRFKGVDHQKAEDLVQEFSLQILENDLLSIADPARGKFRTLLLTALDRFVVSRFRYETAAKRAPESSRSLDAAEVDYTQSAEAPASAAFDRAYALDVIAQVLAKMKQECEATGDAARWVVFENRIVSPMLESTEPVEYLELAQDLGLKDEKAAMNLLVTAKRQFTRLLKNHVRDYVSPPTFSGRQASVNCST